jgi:U3 small nucleolar RNA-associated protein 4
MSVLTFFFFFFFQSPKNIMCSSISNDGQWMAVSDILELRLFRLISHNDNSIQVCKVDSLSQDLKPARLVNFTPDSHRLIVVTLDNTVQLVDITITATTSIITGRLIHEFYEHQKGIHLNLELQPSSFLLLDTSLAERSATIQTMAISHDGQWLASGDHLNRIFIYHLDSLQLHAILPVRETHHVYLTFEPHHNHLIVVYANQFFILYDVDQRILTPFSRTYTSESDFPHMYLNRREKIRGIAFDLTKPDTALLYGLNFMCLVDFTKVITR